MSELVSINDQFVYISIVKKIISGSIFEEVGKGKFEYQRKGDNKFDELVITLPNNSVITYKLDSKSELTYEEASGAIIKLKGFVYNRQPQ